MVLYRLHNVNVTTAHDCEEEYLTLETSSHFNIKPLVPQETRSDSDKWQGCSFMGRRSFIIEFALLQVGIILKVHLMFFTLDVDMLFP